MQFDFADIDPPWSYEVWSDTGQTRNASSHYTIMTDQDILNLRVYDLLSKDALVALWATWPTLPLAAECGKAWNLTYVTCLYLQMKTNGDDLNSWFVGLGHYTRANTEPCLLFKKGKGLGLPADRSVKQIVGGFPYEVSAADMFPELLIGRFERHSRKPIAAYAGIERMYPNAKKIRLFAREQRPGWVSVGNELTGRDIREDIDLLIEDKWHGEKTGTPQRQDENDPANR